MERYTAMYPRGQPGLPDDPVMANVNNLHATGATLGLRRLGGHGPRDKRPHAGVQRLCGLRIEQLRAGASSTPPRHRRPAAASAR
jgi:hypothetical protein